MLHHRIGRSLALWLAPFLPTLASGSLNVQANDGPYPDYEPRSRRIAITSDGRYLIVPNKETHNISVLEVRDEQGNDVHNLVREISLVAGRHGPRGAGTDTCYHHSE